MVKVWLLAGPESMVGCHEPTSLSRKGNHECRSTFLINAFSLFCDLSALAFLIVNLESGYRTVWRVKVMEWISPSAGGTPGKVLLNCIAFSHLKLSHTCLVRHLLLSFFFFFWLINLAKNTPKMKNGRDKETH